MCWMITVPAPSGEGSFGSSSASARGPPVEQAITTVRGRAGRPDVRSTAAGGACCGCCGERTRRDAGGEPDLVPELLEERP